MDTCWELNCDESPNADDPAEKHDFTAPQNYRFVPLPHNPAKKSRICLTDACQKYTKWNAHGCDSFMYRLFCEHQEEWAELITIDTLIKAKPLCVVDEKNE